MPDFLIKILNESAKASAEKQDVEMLYRGRYTDDDTEEAGPKEPQAIEGNEAAEFNQPYQDPNEVEERYVNDAD